MTQLALALWGDGPAPRVYTFEAGDDVPHEWLVNSFVTPGGCDLDGCDEIPRTPGAVFCRYHGERFKMGRPPWFVCVVCRGRCERGRRDVCARPSCISARSRSRRYGLDPQYLRVLWGVQGARCAACDVGLSWSETMTWHLDHSHAYGCHPDNGGCEECVRGILCAACNLRAGNAGDVVEVLCRRGYDDVARYLEDPPWPKIREKFAAGKGVSYYSPEGLFA